MWHRIIFNYSTPADKWGFFIWEVMKIEMSDVRFQMSNALH